MLPEEVVGRYRRYKRGTRKLVSWLVKMVSDFGDIESIIVTLPSSPKANQARQRQQRKKQGKKAKKRQIALEPAELEVSSRQLVELAEAVACIDPPALIPDYILTTVGDVIKGRGECHDWYSGQASSTSTTADSDNETHQYFIGILQRVQDLLQATHALQPQGSHSQSRKGQEEHRKRRKGKKPSLNTLFEHLSVEEPGENAMGGEPAAVTVKTSSGSAQVHVSLQHEGDDPAFQTWCFLQDLADIRNAVMQVWCAHAIGETSFLNASMVTETAFGLLRRADEDFQVAPPTHSTDWEDLIDHLGVRDFIRNNPAWLDPNMSATPQDFRTQQNICRLLFPSAYFHLDVYRSGMDAFCKAAQSGSSVGTQSHGDAVLVPREMDDFGAILRSCYSETHEGSHWPDDGGLISDEFVSGLTAIHRTSTIRMWTVVACQIYLDLYKLLGDQVFSAVKPLQTTTDYSRALFSDMLKYAEESQYPVDDVERSWKMLKHSAGLPESAREHARALIKVDDKDSSRLAQVALKRAGEGFRVMPFPATTGGNLGGYRLFLYQRACNFTNHGNFILLAAHLYRAFRASGALAAIDWSDMEFVLSAFGPNQPLVTPKDGIYDRRRAADHLLLDLGTSPVSMAKDYRPGKHKTVVNRGFRSLTINSPLLKAHCGDGISKWVKYGIEYAGINSVEATLQTLLADELENTKGDNPKRARERHQRRECFTPSELLNTMTNKLQEDEPALNFDFFRFTLACARLIQTIGTLIEGRSPAEYDESDGSYLFLISKLLVSHAQSKQVGQAAAVLRDHVQTSGGTHLQDALAQCSGSLSEEYRPFYEPLSDGAEADEKPADE